MSHCLGRWVACWVSTVLKSFPCSGSFASVHLAFDSHACRQVACKTVVTKVKFKSEMQKVMKEVNILRSLRHVSYYMSCRTLFTTSIQPNINKIIDVVIDERNSWLWVRKGSFACLFQRSFSDTFSWNFARVVTYSHIFLIILSAKARENTSCIRSSRVSLICTIKPLHIEVRVANELSLESRSS